MRLKLKNRKINIKYKYIILIVFISILYIILYNKTNINYLIIDSYDMTSYYKNIPIEVDTKNIINTNNDNSNNDNYLVYIYNTHQTEEYNSDNLYYSITPTVYYASFILKDYLNDLGINSYVETNSIKKYLNDNNLGYNGSYEASRHYLNDAFSKYNSLVYFIDIHRDSVHNTSIVIDDKKYAKVLFVVTTKHSNYEENLNFVNKLNNKINDKYKGLSKGIYKRKDVIFNQDISPKAMLIELGGVDNTLEEISNTLNVLSHLIYEDYNEK